MYALFFYFGYKVYLPQPWVWPSSMWWAGFPELHHDMDPDYKFFYILYAGRYAAGYVSVWCEHKRKDFVEMQVHHSVTVVLVLASYSSSYNRVGGAVMFLLDCADPPLHVAKQFKYMSTDKKDWPQFMADRWFEVREGRADRHVSHLNFFFSIYPVIFASPVDLRRLLHNLPQFSLPLLLLVGPNRVQAPPNPRPRLAHLQRPATGAARAPVLLDGPHIHR